MQRDSRIIAAALAIQEAVAPAYVVGRKSRYLSQISGTEPEDPIVIVDRR